MKRSKVSMTAVVCLLALVALSTVDTFAQNRRVGTAAATELLIPVGGRDLAMGGASLANTSGIEAIHWNPAGLGHLSYGAEGMFSSMTYIADIGISYGAIGANVGEFGNIALSVKSLDFGDIPLTTQDDSEGRGGRIFSPTFVTVGLSYAKTLTDAIAVGTTVKLVSEQIDRASASGVAIDFGVQYHGLAGVQGLQMGVAVKNIGPQMKYDGTGLYQSAQAPGGNRPAQFFKIDAASNELPSVIEIGLGYSGTVSDNMQWTLNSSFTNNNLYLDEYRLGGEYGVKMEDLQLFGRAGVGMVPQAEDDEDIFGPTFGFGVGYLTGGINLTLDYAYRDTKYFDGNQVISLKLGF
ncbi:MAG: PorV/PorQ family protein [Ignavibacteriae bacterium]|nr:PorV/PorQ family protein [Ignavibacteriota bacterium]